MVRLGAKHIVFLSRSGDKKPEAKETIRSLRNQGANVAAYSCDIANRDEIQSVLHRCAKDFPPIRGAIQGAMVLKVCSQDPYNTTLRAVLIQSTGCHLSKHDPRSISRRHSTQGPRKLEFTHRPPFKPRLFRPSLLQRWRRRLPRSRQLRRRQYFPRRPCKPPPLQRPQGQLH